jgi:hypothetical protein
MTWNSELKMKPAKIFHQCMIVSMLLLFLAPCLQAEESATELAKETQNPVADLISVPFEHNMYFETGPEGRTKEALVIKPTIPFALNEDWKFIARPIVPLLNQPPLAAGQNRNYGLGNVQFQGFFSPNDEVDGWIIGFGPYVELPTNSGPDGRLGSDNWSGGPAFVALKMKGPWVYGGLLTHLWSYQGNDAEVNQTSFQPFVNYNMKDGWYLIGAPVITANWSADSRQQWTIPIGGGIGKVSKIGKQNINTGIRAYHNLEAPKNGADWQLQLRIQFLFPKG